MKVISFESFKVNLEFFLKRKLSISELSEGTGLHRNIISKMLNKKEGIGNNASVILQVINYGITTLAESTSDPLAIVCSWLFIDKSTEDLANNIYLKQA